MAANEQGWDDFRDIVGLVDQLGKDARKLGQNIGRLKEMRIEALEDPVRKAEMKKVLDQHFDDKTNTTTKLKNACIKLETLLTWLEENDYIQIEVSNDL